MSEYTFQLTNGTTIGTIRSLENNGPGAESVARVIQKFDFQHSSIIVDGELLTQFPPSDLANIAIVDVDSNTNRIYVSGNHTTSEQLQQGREVILHTPTELLLIGIVVGAEYTSNDNRTSITLVESVSSTLLVDFPNAKVSTCRSFVIADSAYDGQYVVREQGATFNPNGTTSIPLHNTTPFSMPSFDIISVVPGLHGHFIIDNAANGSCLFNVGSTFEVVNNSLLVANTGYTVRSVETSTSYTTTSVSPSSLTVAGSVAQLFVNGKKISVSGGTAVNEILTVASASVVSGSTVINTVEPVPNNIVASASVVLSPAVTRIVVEEIIPNGVGVDGACIAAAPSSYSFSAPPAITSTTPHNYLITWRVAGNLTTKFTPGCPILVVDNSYCQYREFPIVSVTFSAGMTHIVTQVTDNSVISPSPDASGELLYPAPLPQYGVMRATPMPLFSSLKLVGQGSPIYNYTTTWGKALQDNMLHMLEHHTSGALVVPSSFTTGPSSTFVVPGVYAQSNAFVVGSTIEYADEANPTSWISCQVTYATVISDQLEVTTNASVSPSITSVLVRSPGKIIRPLTGQIWYDQSTPQLTLFDVNKSELGILVQTIPATQYVDMGNQYIRNLADPAVGTDATNLQTSDRLYIAKSGGYTTNSNARSGTMTGSLNFGVKPTSANWTPLGINIANGNIGLYGTTSIVFDADGSGDVYMQGSGSVYVDQGSVQVGTAENIILRNVVGDVPVLEFNTSTTDNEVLNLGSNKIINVSTPTQPADAANKAYVDGLANGIVWLQPVLDPNLFDDSRSSPPFITSAVVSATTGASNKWKVVGNYASSFVPGQILTITGNTFAAANKSYVVLSAVNNGANTDITVTASSIPVGVGNNGTATDTSIPTHKTYIVKSPGSGDWSSLSNRAVVYTVLNTDPLTQVQTWGWLDVLGRDVQVGDRFGVFVEPDAEDPMNVLSSGGLAGADGKIATVATTAPLTFTFYTPTEPYAFSVTGTSPVLGQPASPTTSPHFGHSYTFRGTYGTGTYGSTYKWIEFAGPSMLAAGAGLRYAGNVLNVGAGPGIIVTADSIQVDTSYVSGSFVRQDGSTPMTGDLQLSGFSVLDIALPTVGTSAANKDYVDGEIITRVSKLGDTIAGDLTFTAGTVAGIPQPTNNDEAANKVYVDNRVATRLALTGGTLSGSLILTGGSSSITLPNTPTLSTHAANKAYVDNHLPLAGGTLTGALVLSANPSTNMEAATKQYVDAGFVSKTASTGLSANVSITFSGIGEVLGLPAVPSTAGSAASKAYVDNQLTPYATTASVVHLADPETITGSKTFTAATVFDNQVQVSSNGTNTNLLITPTSVALTGTPVTSGGASAISLTAGSNTAGSGGAVTIVGGNGSTSGGNIVITGGQGSSSTGGNVTITSGLGTTNGVITLTAGSGSLELVTTGVWRVGGLAPTVKSQAIVSDTTNPTTASPSWQLVGTRVASAPATSSSPGVIGNWFADDSYFYVYGATGWRRSVISTF